VDEIAFNFLVAGGGANSGSADHDDGSSFYYDHHNVMVYGGHKSNFDGHSKRSVANLLAFPLVYEPVCARFYVGLPPASPGGLWAEAFVNNTCVLASAGDRYLDLGTPCAAGEADFGSRLALGGNTVYAPPGSGASVRCGADTLDFGAWAATGADPGSVFHNETPPCVCRSEGAAERAAQRPYRPPPQNPAGRPRSSRGPRRSWGSRDRASLVQKMN